MRRGRNDRRPPAIRIGLVCLTGGDEGPLAAALVSGGEEAGREVVEQLVRVFGRDSVYVELQRHRSARKSGEIRPRSASHARCSLPVLATNGVRYARAYDREVLDLFTAVRNHTDLDQAGRLLLSTASAICAPRARWRALFRDRARSGRETLELSSRLQFELDDLGYEFPRYPGTRGRDDGQLSRASALPRASCAATGRRMIRPAANARRSRSQHELALIAQLGFAGYFLIVWDIVQFCKRNDILIRAGAALRTPPSAMRWRLRRSIRSAWSCSSSGF